MANSNQLTPSFRYPATIPKDAAHPTVIKSLTQHTKGLVDLNQAMVALKQQVDAKTGVQTSASPSPPSLPPNSPTIIPGDTPAIAHEWIDSYDSSNGLFHQSQPDFTDISGIATTAQIGTGTPSAGRYVDGAAGAWTPLPIVPATLAAVAGKYVVSYDSTTGKFSLSTATGISATITTAPVTVGGTSGSMTFVAGILTAQIQAT